MLLMIVTYVVPLAALAITYTRVGVELWGHKSIGERTASQDETLKSKRKVQSARWTHLRPSFSNVNAATRAHASSELVTLQRAAPAANAASIRCGPRTDTLV